MSKKPTKNEIFENDEFIAIPKKLAKASHMQYVNKEGETVIVPVSPDFKLLYGFLFDQCRSFANQKGAGEEGQDFYQEWPTIFYRIGRRYEGDKNSKKMVKLLEDSGLLVQTKRGNSTVTTKIVFDISKISSIRLINDEGDKWDQEQKARSEQRKLDYAQAKADKLAAIEAAKQQHNQIPQSVKPVEQVPQSKVEQPKPEPVKQEPAPAPKVEPQQADTETNWYKFKDELIKSEPRWDQLTTGQQSTIAYKISNMLSSNPKAVSEVFATEIAKLFYKPKQEQTKAPEQKSSNYSFIANLPSTAQSVEPEYFWDDSIPF